jgi:hypothetical protein
MLDNPCFTVKVIKNQNTTVSTILKTNRFDSPKTNIHDRSLFWLDAGTLIMAGLTNSVTDTTSS